MEFAIGGLAAASAGVLTNPLEVIKHHMELNKKSMVNNTNVVHVGFSLARRDGFKSLQKGLSPAICAHLTSYGMKLGTYQFAQRRGLTTNGNNEVMVACSMATSTVGGILGQYMSSPFYLIKYQHEMDYHNIDSDKRNSYTHTIQKIYKENGFRGFFRGANASLPRALIGTSQLTSFALAKESLNKYEIFQGFPKCTTFLASLFAGLVLSAAMTPFDMILTKLYKQAINPKAKGQKFDGILDCIKKTYLQSGLKPFYRGMGPVYLKLGPHTVLCLVFWEEFKDLYDSYELKYPAYSTDQFYNTKFGFVGGNDDKSDMYW